MFKIKTRHKADSSYPDNTNALANAQVLPEWESHAVSAVRGNV